MCLGERNIEQYPCGIHSQDAELFVIDVGHTNGLPVLDCIVFDWTILHEHGVWRLLHEGKLQERGIVMQRMGYSRPKNYESMFVLPKVSLHFEPETVSNSCVPLPKYKIPSYLNLIKDKGYSTIVIPRPFVLFKRPTFVASLTFHIFQLFGLFSKLLASLMRNYFPKRPSGAPLHTLSKLYDVPIGFVPPPPILRLNIAYFAVAEGWLSLDIG